MLHIFLSELHEYTQVLCCTQLLFLYMFTKTVTEFLGPLTKIHCMLAFCFCHMQNDI